MDPPSTKFSPFGARGVQRSEDGRRVRKFFEGKAELAHEYQNMEMFHCFADAYSSGPPMFVPHESQMGIEMDYVGETLDNFIFSDHEHHNACSTSLGSLTSNELALCLMQCIEVVLLLDNVMLIADANLGNICVTGRGAAIRLHFIDLEKWQSQLHCSGPRQQDDRIMHSNILAILKSLWSGTHMTWKELAEMVFKAFDDDGKLQLPRANVRDQLLRLSGELLRFIETNQQHDPTQAPFLLSAQKLHHEIQGVVTAWYNAKWSSEAAHQRTMMIRRRGSEDWI